MTATTQRTHKFAPITGGNIKTGDQFRWSKESVAVRPSRKRYWQTLHLHSGIIGRPIANFQHYDFRRLIRYGNNVATQ